MVSFPCEIVARQFIFVCAAGFSGEQMEMRFFNETRVRIRLVQDLEEYRLKWHKTRHGPATTITATDRQAGSPRQCGYGHQVHVPFRLGRGGEHPQPCNFDLCNMRSSPAEHQVFRPTEPTTKPSLPSRHETSDWCSHFLCSPRIMCRFQAVKEKLEGNG